MWPGDRAGEARAGLKTSWTHRCSFTQQALIEHLLCTRNCPRHWDRATDGPDLCCLPCGLHFTLLQIICDARGLALPMFLRACVCVCACVCERETETETERQRERESCLILPLYWFLQSSNCLGQKWSECGEESQNLVGS